MIIRRPRRVDGTVYDKTIRPRHEKILKFMPILSGGQSKSEFKNGDGSPPSPEHDSNLGPQVISNKDKPKLEDEPGE